MDKKQKIAFSCCYKNFCNLKFHGQTSYQWFSGLCVNPSRRYDKRKNSFISRVSNLREGQISHSETNVIHCTTVKGITEILSPWASEVSENVLAHFSTSHGLGDMMSWKCLPLQNFSSDFHSSLSRLWMGSFQLCCFKAICEKNLTPTIMTVTFSENLCFDA